MVSSVILCVLCIAMHSASATNQVVLTCGNDQRPGERGPVGPSGKRGLVGSPGREGSRGQKGEPGERDTWRSEFEILQARVTALENQAHTHPTTQPTNSANPTTQPTTSANPTTQPQPQATNCQELLHLGQRSSGFYQIHVNGQSQTIRVYCDQITDGGGWLVIQRRTDGSEDFYRNWEDYRRGFGNKSNEFWLGLDLIHAITNESSYELRIDMEDFANENAYVMYSTFRVGSLADNYRLEVGGYSGNAGDSLKYHNGRQFSTKDQDHDLSSGSNSAVTFHGAWWYGTGYDSNLNGEHLPRQVHVRSVAWGTWRGLKSLNKVEMKIKPA